MAKSSIYPDAAQLIWDRWECCAREYPQREVIIHWDALEKPFRWTYLELIDEALKFADNLMDRGVKSGDVCALIIRHNKFFYPIYMSIPAIGAIPTILAYPNVRLHPDKFLHGISGIAQKAGLDWVLTERELEPTIKPLVINKKSSIKDVLFPLEWRDDNHNKKPNYEKIVDQRSTINCSMPFLLQFSSGTTGLQKGVILSHKAILEHIRRYSEAIKINTQDKIVSWLPLYHDMGLIAAFHLPLAFGIPSIQIDPFQWILAPSIFFYAISQEKATLTWLPNFAYNFMADRIPEKEMENVDLSSMRMFISAGEVVRSESREKFFRRFQKYGVKKESLATMYGMAETVLAITQTEPACEVIELALDRNALTRNIIKPYQSGGSKKICMSSGKPISGCSLKIVDENYSELQEDHIGRILVKSTSLFDGYKNNPEKTNQVCKNGWHLSGDLGFCHKGEYFILGREDDVIIVAGRNIYPEDIEDTVNRVSGVILGRVVAFGVENPETGTQDVHVIAETLYDTKDQKDTLGLAIKQAAMDIDVTIHEVHLVPRRWLIKSSSGKISRKTNKNRILKNIAIEQT